ncbi:MAG: cation-translocating P-type ATPase [Actinomycetota bacterium]
MTPRDDAFDIDLDRGLTRHEALARLEASGPNELPAPVRERLARRIVGQLREPMALLLIGAAAVDAFALGERLNAIAILSIVALNAAITLIEEGKAAGALEALRRMETPMARVVRDGSTMEVPSRAIVPGDLIVLTAGDRVPADLRLVSSVALEVDESLMTGESLPVGKDADVSVDPAAGSTERACEVFSGTYVTRGSGSGVAIRTGAQTELGAIAERLRGHPVSTPLQAELKHLTTWLGLAAVFVAVGVFTATFVRMGMTSEALERSFLAAVALAVAAVPEGLATVVAVALAMGVRRMADQRAIVRRLPAVETLGSTSVLLSDKTGTLTQNHMRLEMVAVGGRAFAPGELPAAVLDRVELVLALCSDAELEPVTGDPLEVALLEAVGGSNVTELRASHPRLASVPFDSERRAMTTLNANGDRAVLSVKGAPETVLPSCTTAIDVDGEVVALGRDGRQGLEHVAADMAQDGMRMLALATRDVAGPSDDLVALEGELLFVGLAGLRDPVRQEAAAAVTGSRSAGMRIVMVTGDHPGTARAVAEEVGLLEPGDRVMTGAELHAEGVPDDIGSVSVYARVDPEQKLQLVHAFQGHGHVVAVTGDGVNDAPALAQADIGVAMGRGSDVAREAADMVVTDDNLATIVAAVREGRGIYDNIRRVVDYLVGGNLSEIAVVVASLALFPELGVPLLPLQLLWINLLTDGPPAIALSLCPPAHGLMRRPPRRRDDRLLGGRRFARLVVRASLIAGPVLGSLAVVRFRWEEPWAEARVVMFSALAVAQLLYAFVAAGWGQRNDGAGGSNPWLVAAVGLGIVFQILVVTVPAAHGIFGTAALSHREWLLVAVAGSIPAVSMTIWSAVASRRES